MAEKINFFAEETAFNIKKKTLLRQWINDCINKEGFKTGAINVIFCSDAYLHEMNLKYLDHDNLTDIITFNYSENMDISGDLFISIERVFENATRFSKNSIDELHRVIVHGILHLCNYNDKTMTEKATMTEKENISLACRPDKLKASQNCST